MDISVGEQLTAKVMDLLNAPADKPKPTIRQRPRPIAVENADGTSGIDGFLLYSLKEEMSRESRTVVRRVRDLRIEIPVAGPPPLDAASDPLYMYILKTLFASEAQAALADDNGKNKLFFLEETGLIWETVSTYVDASICALDLRMTFTTTVDPSVRV